MRLQKVGEYYFSRKLDDIRKLRAQGIDILNLGIGSPDLPPAGSVIDELITAASDTNNHAYQQYRSSKRLRKAISTYYQRIYNVSVDAEHEVLPLLGSKEGIMYVSLAFLNPGDRVLVPNPGYPAYASIAELLGAEVVSYDLLEGNNWQPDFAKLEKTDTEKVKLMWVNYPNMPTGAPATPELFSKLVAFAQAHKILVCNDNPYSLILNDSPLSILSYDKTGKRVLELNSMSKSFNMAGWRVGMVLGHRSYIDAIIQVKSNVDSGMFLPVQHAASHALELPDNWHSNRNEIYKKRKALATKILETIGCRVSKNQVGLFVWGKIPNEVENVEILVDNLLVHAHIFITPGKIFGSNGNRFLRMSLTSSVTTYQIALKRVKKWKRERLMPV